jgi:hypothetical protein
MMSGCSVLFFMTLRIEVAGSTPLGAYIIFSKVLSFIFSLRYVNFTLDKTSNKFCKVFLINKLIDSMLIHVLIIRSHKIMVSQ